MAESITLITWGWRGLDGVGDYYIILYGKWEIIIWKVEIIILYYIESGDYYMESGDYYIILYYIILYYIILCGKWRLLYGKWYKVF